jgi:hypothetical protein
MFVHKKSSNHPTPVTLPLLYFGFRPRNPWKMTKNEMNVFYNILNIDFPYDNLYNFNLYSNPWFYTHFWLYSSNLYFHLYSFTSSSVN